MEQTSSAYYPQAQGLYNPANEHDACGVGMVVDTKAIPSQDIVKKGITILERILHRGATGCDPETGDGAGMLLQIPDEFFRSASPCTLPAAGTYAVGMIFLPKQENQRAVCMKEIQSALDTEGFTLLGTRVVPVQEDKIGKMARESAPAIEQIFISAKDEELKNDNLERQLYILRRVMEHNVQAALPELGDKFYICSLSARTIVYKGLLMAPQLPLFYPDLTQASFKSCMAIVHQRYSTNTFPSWPLAHPFRYMAHNGEVNTLRGNLNQMSALEGNLESPLFGPDIKKLLPIIPAGQSDSASLDNAVELLTTGGRSMCHSMMMLVPQAFGKRYFLGEDLRGFFEYHAGIMAPWDGPAAVCFSNGLGAGALIDRNGLRPARYELTDDGLFILASEAGVLDTDPAHVVKRGCLTPGDILWIDFDKKRISYNDEVKTSVARHKPYRRWCKENHIEIHGFFDSVDEPETHSKRATLAQQSQFGYTQDEIEKFILPMANSGHEPISAMGNDAALAVLSERPQNLFNYFKQQFAQVTNPPIDPIREQLGMSLTTFIGNPANILDEKPEMARNIKLARPILTEGDLAALKANKNEDFRCITLPTGFSTLSDKGLEEALKELAVETEKAIAKGYRIIILSDRGLSYNEAPIPSMLAVAAVNAKLRDLGVRTSTGVIAETGEARQVMHFALLLGYGATAVCPWLAFDSIAKLAATDALKEDISATKAVVNFIEAVEFGLLKIMSKMGISTLRSYRGAQIFEAIGLGDEVVNTYFPGTSSRVGGITLADIAKESATRLNAKKELKFTPQEKLEDAGLYKWKRGGEKHLWTSKVIASLQKSLRNEDYAQYKIFSAMVTENEETLCNLRGLFDLKSNPIPLEEVESEVHILRRFVSGAMSLGAISKEAHEAIAIAMNRIGGMSNSGEGGEDPSRYTIRDNGDDLCSAIKQIASGRFGVTAEYLANARELQIKVAQGAKPGEGGQLPGKKVNEEIARVRHSTPGVTLISPPPHHDIYSIEDLAQLIFDLRNSNPKARVSVKLVSEVGVGTVAAGVAKGGADMVLISGHDGGTGASPLTSISYAGMPWELGLAETHQTLVINGLRDKIRVQTDGLITNGRDVVIATLLGAEEFGFATSVLIALGCVMARVCDKNTCPVGVATQDEKLRGRMRGKPENVINYLTFIARETREYLASIGMRSIDEAVGRADLLHVERAQAYWKTQNLDFSNIIRPESQNINGAKHENNECEVFDKGYLDQVQEAVEKGTPIALDLPICNTDRSVGTRLSYYIAKKYGNAGLAEDTIKLTLKGTAGQSFGAFLAKGISLHLKGQANDYVGKGLSGGKIILTPFEGSQYDPSENVIAGNVHLYGATGGQLFVHGKVGERFAVRNSGADAVIEGAGDHCCEYMTGGTVVLLGESGHNFGAGMSGGLAYVWDKKHIFDRYCNLDMIDLDPVKDVRDVAKLRSLIEEHAALTGSERAKAILADFDNELPNFVKVFPQEYRRVLTERAAAEAAAKEAAVAEVQ
ncbi:MAG: glutamate synthase large subunit [Akkermansia sp.]